MWQHSGVNEVLKFPTCAPCAPHHECHKNELGSCFNHHGTSISYSRVTLHHSTVGIHQSCRVDPYEAGLLAGIQDHLHMDGVAISHHCDADDPPGIDLDHLGFVCPMELPAEKEFLTDPDVPVFHSLNIPSSCATLHQDAHFCLDA